MMEKDAIHGEGLSTYLELEGTYVEDNNIQAGKCLSTLPKCQHGTKRFHIKIPDLNVSVGLRMDCLIFPFATSPFVRTYRKDKLFSFQQNILTSRFKIDTGFHSCDQGSLTFEAACYWNWRWMDENLMVEKARIFHDAEVLVTVLSILSFAFSNQYISLIVRYIIIPLSSSNSIFEFGYC
jgi:hypothetical protein